MAASIAPGTVIGAVHLVVRDLERSLAFYQDRLGFRVLDRDGDTARLGADRSSLLVLAERRDAPRVTGTTGLYHFAVLVPSRVALGQVLSHLLATRTPMRGASDHGVSEALYLDDPEGNGIEIYRDRPRAEWPREGEKLAMATEPLDLDSLVAEPDTGTWSGLPSGTVIGHVHLRVADIGRAEAFYCDVLGFELMQRYGPSASFVSAGGYHHHIGFNTWGGAGAKPPPDGAAGLRHFDVVLPDDVERQRLLERLRGAGVELGSTPAGPLVRDPSGNAIVLAAAA